MSVVMFLLHMIKKYCKILIVFDAVIHDKLQKTGQTYYYINGIIIRTQLLTVCNFFSVHPMSSLILITHQ